MSYLNCCKDNFTTNNKGEKECKTCGSPEKRERSPDIVDKFEDLIISVFEKSQQDNNNIDDQIVLNEDISALKQDIREELYGMFNDISN